MKAFLLAAGYGSRLRPLTDSVPKCLVPISGQPLLGWWLDLLIGHKVSEVLVNTHYLPEQVREYIYKYNQQHTGLIVREFYETELLGSGGTVKANREFIGDEDAFLICYADNLTDIDLSSMLTFHREHKGLLTMALFRTNKPEQCGIAELDVDSRIVRFIEKPELPKSNLANAGVYIANTALFDEFPDEKFIDFGKDVLPQITGRMYGWETNDYLIDVGTIDNYEKAKREWKYDHN